MNLDIKKYNDIIEHFKSDDNKESSKILNSSKIKKSHKNIIDVCIDIEKSYTEIKETFEINQDEKLTNKIQEHFIKKDPFKKIEDAFKQVEKFFKEVKKAFTFNTEKLIAIILTIIMPFFGQIIARIMWLDGSLDKPWLLFFGIPPLTLFPAFMMMFGLVNKGKGGKPWDAYIILPIIVNIASTFILPKFFDKTKEIIVRYILMAISFIIIYWLRSSKICNNTRAKITTLTTDALMSYILMMVFSIAIQFIPFIGIIFKIISKIIPYSNLIMDSFAILFIYVITNMFNGSNNHYCNQTSGAKYIITLIIISAFLSVTTKLKIPMM
jgi:hypothetical protein